MTTENTRFTVIHSQETVTEQESETYLKLMHERSIPVTAWQPISLELGQVELRRRAICFFNTQGEAQEFADEISRRTQTQWIVKDCP